MSEESEELDKKLTENDSLKQEIERNKFLMDFDLLSSGNPTETNRIIFIAILLLVAASAVWLVSYYI